MRPRFWRPRGSVMNRLLAVFPELSLSGYAIEDLLMQQSLLESVEQALAVLVDASAELMTVLVVGCPLQL
jgi:NAD+ synthase (glutamine-hydrolysing)